MRSSTVLRAVSSALVSLGLVSSTFAAHTSAARPQAKVYNIYLSNNYLGNDWRVQRMMLHGERPGYVAAGCAVVRPQLKIQSERPRPRGQQFPITQTDEVTVQRPRCDA